MKIPFLAVAAVVAIGVLLALLVWQRQRVLALEQAQADRVQVLSQVLAHPPDPDSIPAEQVVDVWVQAGAQTGEFCKPEAWCGSEEGQAWLWLSNEHLRLPADLSVGELHAIGVALADREPWPLLRVERIADGWRVTCGVQRGCCHMVSRQYTLARASGLRVIDPPEVHP